MARRSADCFFRLPNQPNSYRNCSQAAAPGTPAWLAPPLQPFTLPKKAHNALFRSAASSGAGAGVNGSGAGGSPSGGAAVPGAQDAQRRGGCFGGGDAGAVQPAAGGGSCFGAGAAQAPARSSGCFGRDAAAVAAPTAAGQAASAGAAAQPATPRGDALPPDHAADAGAGAFSAPDAALGAVSSSPTAPGSAGGHSVANSGHFGVASGGSASGANLQQQLLRYFGFRSSLQPGRGLRPADRLGLFPGALCAKLRV